MKEKTVNLPKCSEHGVHSDKVASARLSLPVGGTALALSDFFKLLGDPTRLRILFAIEREPLCVCDIAETLGMTKSAVSHQLKMLRQNDLVRFEREGKNVIYSLADDHVRDIIDKATEHINE